MPENEIITTGPMGSLTPSATMAITAKAAAMAAAGEDVCSLSAGEPDFDTPAHINQAAIDAINAGKTKYTASAGINELRKAIADKFAAVNGIATSPDRVIVAPGGKFSVFSAVGALCGPGEEVIIPAPFWVSYPEIVKASGAKPVIVPCSPEENYELTPERFESAITPNTKMVILNTPNNPTGAVYSRKTLEGIAKVAVKHGIIILTDEIYEILVYDDQLPHVSIASLGEDVANLTVTVNGLSKAYAMTGWRIGYLTAPKHLFAKIAALQSHTTTCATSASQYAAVAALTGDQKPVEEMRKAFKTRCDCIYDAMSAIPGVSCVKPKGAFYIFCDVSSFGLSSIEFCERLLSESKVAVIPGAPFGGEGHIRLSFAYSPELIERAVKRIADFCGKLTK